MYSACEPGLGHSVRALGGHTQLSRVEAPGHLQQRQLLILLNSLFLQFSGRKGKAICQYLWRALVCAKPIRYLWRAPLGAEPSVGTLLQSKRCQA